MLSHNYVCLQYSVYKLATTCRAYRRGCMHVTCEMNQVMYSVQIKARMQMPRPLKRNMRLVILY